MDGSPESITPQHLYVRLGTAAAPLLLDVRRPESFAADEREPTDTDFPHDLEYGTHELSALLRKESRMPASSIESCIS